MRDQERQSQAFWDQEAEKEALSGAPGFMVSDRRFAAYRDAVEKALFFPRIASRVDGAAQVLEVGCGSGRWTVDLARRYAAVTATDISEKMLAVARQAVVGEGLDNVRLVHGAFDSLEHGEARYDLAFFGACLHYMSDEAICDGLERLSAAVGPQAVVASKDTVSVLGRTFHRSERYATGDPAIYRTPEAYEALFSAHGWRLQDSWPAYVTPLSWRLRGLLPDRLLARLMAAEGRRAELEVRYAHLIDRPKDKQHRFFIYTRV